VIEKRTIWKYQSTEATEQFLATVVTEHKYKCLLFVQLLCELGEHGEDVVIVQLESLLQIPLEATNPSKVITPGIYDLMKSILAKSDKSARYNVLINNVRVMSEYFITKLY
jgi:hypothetical protein